MTVMTLIWILNVSVFQRLCLSAQFNFERLKYKKKIQIFYNKFDLHEHHIYHKKNHPFIKSTTEGRKMCQQPCFVRQYTQFICPLNYTYIYIILCCVQCLHLTCVNKF